MKVWCVGYHSHNSIAEPRAAPCMVHVLLELWHQRIDAVQTKSPSEPGGLLPTKARPQGYCPRHGAHVKKTPLSIFIIGLHSLVFAFSGCQEGKKRGSGPLTLGVPLGVASVR